MHPQHHGTATRRLWTALVFGAATGVTGCVDPASLAVSGVSAVSFAYSGRTVTDHAMSLATDQNCAMMHSLEGDPWCQPHSDRALADPAPAVYCYRSIAAVTCYRQPNPHDTRTRRMKAPTMAAPPPAVGPADVAAK